MESGHYRMLPMLCESDHEYSNPSQTMAEEEEDQRINRRIQRLSLHLNPYLRDEEELGRVVELVACAGVRPKLIISASAAAQLSDYMRGKHRDLQDRVYEYFNGRPDLHTPVEISKDDHRQLCMRQLLGLVREAQIRPFVYVAQDPDKYFSILEAVGSVDISLGIKMGVQYRLPYPTLFTLWVFSFGTFIVLFYL